MDDSSLFFSKRIRIIESNLDPGHQNDTDPYPDAHHYNLLSKKFNAFFIVILEV